MRKITLFFVITGILLACLLPGASALENLYFVAYNDTIPLELSNTMELTYSGSILYAPKEAFTVPGLNITPFYDKNSQTITLFSGNKRLTFDLTQGGWVDENENTGSNSAVIDRGTVYLPVLFSVAHFGVYASVLTNSSGYKILRFVNGNQVYDDQLFVQKAENLISYRLEQYQQEQAATRNKAASKPAPPAGAAHPPTQSNQNKQEVPEEPEEELPISVYLGIVGLEYAEENIEELSNKSIPAVFFCTAEEIANHQELVRTIRSCGYPIGLYVPSEEVQPENALSRANELLLKAISSKTLLALIADNLESHVSGYCYLKEGKAISPTLALKREGQSSFILIRGNCRYALNTLNAENVSFYQLQETSLFY